MDTKYLLYLTIMSIIIFLFGVIYSYDKDIVKKADRSIDLTDGTYVRFVFIGSSSCEFSNNEETHKMITYLKSELESVINQTFIHFITTGISYDLSSTNGIEYLEKTGPYNELLTGSGSLNLGIINYTKTGSSTPRVLLFHEKYDTKPIGLNIDNFRESQILINSYSGLYEIRDLYELIQSSSDNEIINHFGLHKL